MKFQMITLLNIQINRNSIIAKRNFFMEYTKHLQKSYTKQRNLSIPDNEKQYKDMMFKQATKN